MRTVECTEAFREAAANYSDYYGDYVGTADNYYDDIADLETLLYYAANVLTSSVWPRFYISLGSMMPLLLCGLVSLNRRIESVGLRIFCWNCVFVNFLFTLSLGSRAFLLEFGLKTEERCFYEGGFPQVRQETPEARYRLKDILVEEFTKWTIFSVAMSLLVVRIASYRVCTSALKYAGNPGRLKWIVAMLASDAISIIVTLAQSPFYMGMLDVRIRAVVAASSVGTIWLGDLVISLLSLRAVYNFRVSNKALTKKQRSDYARLVSFILLSISPALQLAPFAYTTMKVAIDDYLNEIMMACIHKVKGHDDDQFDDKELAVYLKNCGYSEEDFNGSSSSETPVADLLILACRAVNIFKPYIEAFTILFLFSNFRAVLLSKTKKAFGCVFCRRQNAIFATSSATHRSQHDPTTTRRHSSMV